MDISKAVAILEDSRRDNFRELDFLIDIRNECEGNSQFAVALSKASGFYNPERLKDHILTVIDKIGKHEASMICQKRTDLP